MRVGNLEFRNDKKEIVCWNGSSCFSILTYVKTEYGYDITFIGNRPFDLKEEEDKKNLFKLMEYGQTILMAEFKLLNDLD